LEGGRIPRPGSGGIAEGSENQASTLRKDAEMTILWIIVTVLAALALVWVISRRRSRRA
jgi:hypothetical protein